MRLLHTSDWHLGQCLHNFDRQAEHQRFLDWLLDAIVTERVDALLVAGDVFDSANPPASAQRQLYAFLREAKRRTPALDVVIIAGNHDSAGRLEAPAPLLDLYGVHVIGTPDPERLLVPLHGADGTVRAWCIAMPFLRPADVVRHGGEDAYLGSIAQLYADAWARAQACRKPGQAIIAMGHCHMVDGAVSPDSERRIVIGGSEALPAAVFDPGIAYVALGHLHLAQRVGQQERVRYAGSPLPMSFAETDYPHQVLCVDLDGERLSALRSLPVPRSVPMLRVPRQPAPTDEALAALAALEPPSCEPGMEAYLEVCVLLDQPEPGLRARVETALAGKAVRLAKIDPVRRSVAPADEGAALSLDQLAALSPADIFQRLYQQRYGEPAPADLRAAFAELSLQGEPE